LKVLAAVEVVDPVSERYNIERVHQLQPPQGNGDDMATRLA
jgi:hypothetical protein